MRRCVWTVWVGHARGGPLRRGWHTVGPDLLSASAHVACKLWWHLHANCGGEPLSLMSGDSAQPSLLPAQHATPPIPRWVPVSDVALKASIFTWWEILDHHMQSFPPETLPDPMFGYIRAGAQLDAYIRIVRQPGVRRYCEIGSNGGHGTVAMLLANPNLDVVSFDQGAWPYSAGARKLISDTFPGRVRSLVGSSYGNASNRDILANRLSQERLSHGRLHVRQQDSCLAEHEGVAGCFAREVQRGREAPCDVVLIDGDHSLNGVLADMAVAMQLVRCETNHTVLLDDVGMSLSAAGRAVEQASHLGLLQVRQKFHYARSQEPDNPCLRWFRRVRDGARGWTAGGRRVPHLMCVNDWGFVVAQFVGPPYCKAGRAGVRPASIPS